MRRRPGRFAVALFLFPVSAGAAAPVTVDAGPDWTLTFTGQVRPRLTLHSGLDFRGSESEWREYVTQRARLGLTAESASGVAVTTEVQDVRAWGEEASPEDFSAKGLDLHQAFARIPIANGLELRLGRQEMSLDDERLLGVSDFNQRARAFDGGRLFFQSLDGHTRVDALYAKISEPARPLDGHVPPSRDGDVDFGGVHASLEFVPGLVVSPLYLVHVRQAPGDVRHTAGAHVRGEARGFFYRAEGYYQWGKLGVPAVAAFLAAGRAGYVANLPWKPGVSAWAELLSGDGTPQGTFDTLYATNHRYYGEMDFLLNIPQDTRGLGLVDLGARLEADPIGSVHAALDGHFLRTYQKPEGESETLGGELDVKLAWAPMDYVTLDAFYGFFLPGPAMIATKGYDAGTTLHPESLVYLTTNVQF